MLSHEAITEIDRITHPRRSKASPAEARWMIAPLTLGRTAHASVTAQRLPVGVRLGEHVVTEARGQDGACELYVVTHAERGSLHMARVVGREHAAVAPTMLEAARRIEEHPQRNLRAVLATGWTDEATPRAFVVHERLVGRSLASLLAGSGGVEWPLLLAIGLQSAQALAALHRIGLAHTALRPDDMALVHVAGDQFRVVIGGLEQAQTITPDASANEEPRVRRDLHALGTMLAALAASREASAAALPEALANSIARMTDPRRALRPMTATEIYEQLSVVSDHVDPDLSGAHMLCEAFQISRDDFEVWIDEDPPPARSVDLARPRRRAPRWLPLLLVGLVCFVAGAALRDLQRADPQASHEFQAIDDDRGLAASALRRVPEQTLPAPLVILPRCPDPPPRVSWTRVPRVVFSPEPTLQVEPLAPEDPEDLDDLEDPEDPEDPEEADLLLPIPARRAAPDGSAAPSALLATAGPG